MNPLHAAAASSVVLTLMLATPAVIAEQQRDQAATRGETGMQTSGTMDMQTTGTMGQSVDVSDIKGKQLVKEVGTIDEIVREKDGDKHFAVVSLTDGDKKIAIPLDKLEMRGNALTAPQAASSKDELKSQSEYKKDKYQQVTAGERIDRSEFAAFEQQGDKDQGSLYQGSGLQQDRSLQGSGMQPQGTGMQQGSGTQQEGGTSGTRY